MDSSSLKKSCPSAKKIFDYILVVDLDPNKRCTITYRYPPRDEAASSKEDPYVHSILGFCFPDLEHITEVTHYDPVTFTFILTDMTGGRRFGYCRRVLPLGNVPRYPQAFCVLGYIPCYELFSQILAVVDLRLSIGPELCSEFAAKVYAESMPAPGQSLALQVRNKANQLESYKFNRPADSDRYLDSLNFDAVLAHISPANIVSLFASIAVERRVIFMSKNVTLLSEVIQALLGLLYPTSWQHVLIPVLPSSLLNFLCAPVPFIVGIMTASLNDVIEMKPDMEESCLFDIDSNKYIWNPFQPQDTQLIPPAMMQNLLNGIKKCSPYTTAMLSGDIKKTTKEISKKELNAAIADEFMALFVTTLRTYSSYLIGLPGSKQWAFNADGFRASIKDPHVHKFATAFLATQLFEQFNKAREENKDLYVGPFEQNVRMLNQLEKASLLAGSDKERSVLQNAISSMTGKQQQSGSLFDRLFGSN